MQGANGTCLFLLDYSGLPLKLGHTLQNPESVMCQYGLRDPSFTCLARFTFQRVSVQEICP